MVCLLRDSLRDNLVSIGPPAGYWASVRFYKWHNSVMRELRRQEKNIGSQPFAYVKKVCQVHTIRHGRTPVVI